MPAKYTKHRASIGITFGTATIKSNWGDIIVSDSPQYFIPQGGGSARTVNSQLYIYIYIYI